MKKMMWFLSFSPLLSHTKTQISLLSLLTLLSPRTRESKIWKRVVVCCLVNLSRATRWVTIYEYKKSSSIYIRINARCSTFACIVRTNSSPDGRQSVNPRGAFEGKKREFCVPCAYKDAFPVLYCVTFWTACFLHPLQNVRRVLGTYSNIRKRQTRVSFRFFS